MKFNNTPTPFILNSATRITAKVPVGATTGRISITKASGTVTSTTVFTVALPAPTGLQAKAISSTWINLSWVKSVKDSSYVVEMSLAASGPYTVLATLGTSENQYAHSGLTPGATHYYRVKAAYTPNWAYSNVVNATTPFTSPPNPPYLTAKVVSKTQVNLEMEVQYEIETNSLVLERAKASEGIYSVISVLNGNQGFFVDENLLVGTSYNYRLKAINYEGDSPYTQANITTDPTVTVYNALPQWNKRLGGSGNDWLGTIIRTPEGGYLLGGRSQSGATGDRSQPGRGGSDFWVVKLDARGNKLWDKRYGGSSYDAVEEIVTTADGGYLLAGMSSSGIGGDRSESLRGRGDYWIVKIDANGNRQWDHRYGGSGQDELHSLIKTSDGGYLLGGFSNSGAEGDKSQPSRGRYDYWIVKVNASGVKQWDKRFGGSEDDQLASVVQNADGSYLLGGSSSSPVSGDQSQQTLDWDAFMYGPLGDYWIVKINSTGAKQWDRRYGGGFADLLSAVITTKDGGYLLGGSSKSRGTSQYLNCYDYIDHFYNYSNWIVKINSIGVPEWDKTFLGGNSQEAINDDFGSDKNRVLSLL